MSLRTELESTARRWISLWCTPVDWDLFDRLHSPDFEDHSAAGRPSTKEAFAAALAELVRVFPDLKTTVDDLVVDEATGRVAVRWSAEGTNRATFLGRGPTGKKTPITGIEIIDVRDGRIVRRWGEWDITAHTEGGEGRVPEAGPGLGGQPGLGSQRSLGGRPGLAKVLDRTLLAFFWNGMRVTLRRPGQAWQFSRVVRWQAAAAKTREEWRKRGIPVPPIIIFSITHQCNLECAGCYARSFENRAEAPAADRAAGLDAAALPGELSESRLRGIVAEADQLGVSFFVVAGGEPLMRPEFLDIAARFPRVLFLLLTNGVLVDKGMVDRLTGLKNVVPMLSLEGTAGQTDERRGPGTYRRLMQVMGTLKDESLFFGCSLTLTSRNFSQVLDEHYIRGLVGEGCRFFLFLDYTPTDETTADWVLTESQRQQVMSRIQALRKRHAALFTAVPWDEQAVGGCLSSGRGFVHINASGDLEPCPFAPYSDVNLNDTSLLEALRSPFLAGLRALPELSQYVGGGCALWKNREQVERVLAESGTRSARSVLRGG